MRHVVTLEEQGIASLGGGSTPSEDNLRGMLSGHDVVPQWWLPGRRQGISWPLLISWSCVCCLLGDKWE